MVIILVGSFTNLSSQLGIRSNQRLQAKIPTSTFLLIFLWKNLNKWFTFGNTLTSDSHLVSESLIKEALFWIIIEFFEHEICSQRQDLALGSWECFVQGQEMCWLILFTLMLVV